MIEVAIRHHLPNFVLDVHFRVGEGVTVLFGPSGSGKSLTIRAIAGLFCPQQGYIRVGEDVWLDTEEGIWIPPQKRRVGYVPQHYGLFPHLNVAQNIAFGLRHLEKGERDRRVSEVVRLMQLEGLESRHPRELSGGQQQRVALARVLVIQPRVLLLDEALSSLDPVLREELQDEVRLIHRQYGMPVLLITHDVQEAYMLADQIVVIHQGKVVQTGNQEDIFRRPATPTIARAVGMRNIFTGVVQRHALDATEIMWEGHTLRIPRCQCLIGERVTFGIRPEDVIFVREHRPLKYTHNIVEVLVVDDHPTGFDHMIRLQLADVPGIILYARLPHVLMQNLGIRPGQKRRVLLRVRAIHVFSPVKN